MNAEKHDDVTDVTSSSTETVAGLLEGGSLPVVLEVSVRNDMGFIWFQRLKTVDKEVITSWSARTKTPAGSGIGVKE